MPTAIGIGIGLSPVLIAGPLGSAVVGATFYILAENNDKLQAENNDLLRTEQS